MVIRIEPRMDLYDGDRSVGYVTSKGAVLYAIDYDGNGYRKTVPIPTLLDAAEAVAKAANLLTLVWTQIDKENSDDSGL